MIPAPPIVPSNQDANPKASLTEIAVAQPVISKLIQQWNSVDMAVANARKDRRQRIDIESLRAAGKLGAHEKHIGVRIIDNNIQRDMPPYVAYIKQSRRAAIFKDPPGVKIPVDITTQLESEVSDYLRYPGWEFDWIRWIDGAELHGYDWLEVLYDDNKPGKVATNHIGTSELIYDLAVKDIQDSRMVLRRYRPTIIVLDQLAQKNGFDPASVKLLKQQLLQGVSSSIAENAEHQHDNTSVMLYKIMFKERGVVMVAWYSSLMKEQTKWLREPRVFWNGVKTQESSFDIDPLLGIQTPTVKWVRAPETVYPYYPLRYRVTEDATISETQGRAEMDLHVQEAHSSVFSSTVNMAYEASQTMWAPKKDDPSVGGSAPKQLKATLKKGAIWDRPMDAFTSPAPDPMLPKVLEMLDMRNADNINQPAWTVNNRQDSRKTATEISAASQAQMMMSSTAVVVLSVSAQMVLNAVWRIIQSQALQGIIPLLIDPETGQNNSDVIALSWRVLPAGDIDYVEREEIIQKMQQDWPVIQNTGAAMIFLEEYLRMRYPKICDRFLEAIKAGDAKKQVIQSLSALLKTAVTTPDGQLSPEWAPHAAQLQQVQMQTQQALSMP